MKMTEKEFMGLIAEEMKSRGYALTPAARESASAAARTAGLEFAPEPVELPERIAFGPILGPKGFRPALLPEEGIWGPDIEMAVYAAARDRYRAYPGLKKAAEALAAGYRAAGWFDLRPQLIALEAELAKGPK